jgi:hypothetical protein
MTHTGMGLLHTGIGVSTYVVTGRAILIGLAQWEVQITLIAIIINLRRMCCVRIVEQFYKWFWRDSRDLENHFRK